VPTFARTGVWAKNQMMRLRLEMLSLGRRLTPSDRGIARLANRHRHRDTPGPLFILAAADQRAVCLCSGLAVSGLLPSEVPAPSRWMIEGMAASALGGWS
jgi:hypothetical protein